MEADPEKHRLDVGDVTFYWRTKSSRDQAPHEVPTRLPFEFSFESRLQLILQSRNARVLSWLDRVYREDSNVGYLQEGHALASSYGGEFLDFLSRAMEKSIESVRSVLDIGCGGIYLLRQLQARGLIVTGVDPSPVTVAAGQSAGIEIIPSFYPCADLQRRFDFVFHYDVLEHVADPVEFLRAHHSNLSPGGSIGMAVPDCTDSIACGDISMLLHEHLNYFDLQSLELTVRNAGFVPIALERARHGGVLLCHAVPADQAIETVHSTASTEKFERFAARAGAASESFRRYADLALSNPANSLGVYVPLRALPYLCSLHDLSAVRFFDDDPGLHNRFFDGFDIPIENFEDLIGRPVSHLLICSFAFGERIAARLRASGLAAVQFNQWRTLFSS